MIMKRKYFFIIPAIFVAIGALISCYENIIDETQYDNGQGEDSEFKDVHITSNIVIKDLPDNYDVSELKILSLSGEWDVDINGTSKIITYEGLFPQILMLANSNDEVLLMTRGGFHEGEIIEISVRSTAIALATMHPALSGVKSHMYYKLEQLVTESPAFHELEEAIAVLVKNGQTFVAPDNMALTTALNKVFEQVVAATEEDISDEELPDLGNSATNYTSSFTRAPELKGVTTIAGINVGPFHVTTSGSKLIIENYSLTPLYTGLVTHHNKTENFNIPSGGDRGVTFFFDNSWGSEKVEYSFTQEGEYQFAFDKTTNDSYIDQARHNICNLLEVLGLPLSKGMIFNLSSDLLNFMTTRGFDIVGKISRPDPQDGKEIAWEITTTICGGFLEYIKDGYFEKWLLNIGAKEAMAQMSQTLLKKLVSVYAIYQACRGAINAVMRFTMRLESPDNVAFGLYYYQGEITTATKASIAKYSGDNQEGLIGHRLNEPLRVKVTTIGSDGSEVTASNFHRVKFETDVHNGITLDDVVATDPDGYAQTFWTLDPDNNETQYLKAVVIDIVTGEVISDDVVFSATPTQTADVTFTLDWNPTDSNCDIDLHVYDPEGHHIYYNDMNCGCGGFLDRDDLHGPGPEHIYYTQAQPGKYHVYVHHFESDSKGSVGFTVTTEYGERRFVNRSSVSYHNEIYVGTLEVGGNSVVSASRGVKQSDSIRFYYDENVPVLSIENLPKK